jgi:16S rRNA processing protein RimM
LRFLNNVSSQSEGTPQYLVIGRIVKPHGLRGEVILTPLYNVEPVIPDIKNVVCYVNGKERRLQIVRARPHKGRFIVKFSGIDKIEDCQFLIDMDVYASAEFFEDDIKKKILLWQLKDLNIYSREGNKIGILSSVFETPAHPVIVVETVNGNEFLLPAVDNFIVDFDINKRALIIAPPEGLFDIYDI